MCHCGTVGILQFGIIVNSLTFLNFNLTTIMLIVKLTGCFCATLIG